MNFKNKISVKKIIVSILILLMMLFISKVSMAINWTSGGTGNTQIQKQLHKSKNGAYVSKKVDQLKEGDVFWITGNGSEGPDQVFRSRAVFCTERENSLTQAQNEKYIQYKIMSVNRINTFSNHTAAEKGLAYIASIERNGGGDFGSYKSAQTDEPVQNAFWTYSSQNKSNIHIFGDRIGKVGKDVGNSKEIVEYANAYKNFVNGGITTSAKISNVKADWNSDYTKLTISYNLDYKENDLFGKVTNVSISYNEYTIKDTGKNGNNSVSIDNINTIPNNGCEFVINVTYTYTYVESIICDFSNPDYKGQNLAIVSGLRKEINNTSSAKGKIPTKTTDVSMQKYITKVTDGKKVETKYSGRENKYAESDAGLNTQGKYIHQNSRNGKISNNNVSTGDIDCKKKGYVEIEAGDTVEYTIEVYNNGKVSTEVTLNDKTITTAKIEKVLKDGQVILKDKTGEFNYKFELSGGKSATFKVYVKYDNYSKSLIVNKAWIDSSPLNNTEYRTIDADYVKMKEYKVSLEKWVSSVGKNEDSSINVADKFIDKRYPYLIEYLKNNSNITISDLKEACKDLTADELQYIINNKEVIDSNDIDYLKADLNNDGKVDIKDLNILRAYEVYKNLGSESQEIIKKYINADLDNDGRVTQKDFEIYKVLRANLYNKPERIMQYAEGQGGIERNIEEQALNEKDIHMFILKSMYTNNKFNNEGLNYLKLKRLSKDKTFEETKSGAKGIIEEYIRSDINNNGVVNEEDAYVIYNGYLIVNYNSSEIDNWKVYLLEPTEEIDNIGEEEVNNLYEEYIKKYDLNSDLAINEIDINLLKKYNDRYNAGEDGYKLITQWENKNQDKNLLEEIKNQLVIRNSDTNNFDVAFDLDEDGDIDVDDIKLSFQFDDEEFEEFKQEIKNILTINNKDYDANGDEKLSYDDYELVEEYQAIKDKIGEEYISSDILLEAIKKYNIFNEDIYYEDDSELIIDFSEKDIYAIKIYKGLKEYNENFKDFDINYYDFDENNQLNENDIAKINEIKDLNINLNNFNINSFIESFTETSENELKNLNTDLNDSNTNDSILGDNIDYDLLIKTIQDTSINSKEILQNKDLYKDVTNSNYNYYDINNGIIKYTENGLYSYLDANEDGIIDENDIAFLKDNYKELSKVEVSKSNIENIISKDTNGDGAFDKADKDFIDKCKANKEKYDINKDKKNNEDDLNLFLDIKKLNGNDERAILKYLRNNNGSSTQQKPDDREGKAEYLTEVNGVLKDNTEKDSKWTQHNTYKYNNVVSVENGDFVTYTIKVTNDGDTDVYISEIVDSLPKNGKVDYTLKVEGRIYNRDEKQITSTELGNVLLKPGEKATITITVKVTESNMSTAVLENTAEITQMKNKNGIVVQDSTPWNNKDSDYIQLRDITISGFVWNDRATNKENNNYNGLYKEDDKDIKLENITVYLYQELNGSHVKTYSTTTNADEKYTFNSQIIKGPIKGPKEANSSPWTGEKGNYTSRWKGSHYSYYIIFEYDGITYTSTPDGKTCVSVTDTTAFNNGNYKINSNAKEDNGAVKVKRGNFNNRFSKINKDSGINYTTKNDKGYIPQSNHVYNDENMAMQSSTDLIKLSDYKNNPNIEEQLGFINLGLRGRDIFDLELTSDVSKVEVTVNGQRGVYTDTNKVNIRNSDFPDTEDMANKVNEEIEENVTEYDKPIRNTDLNTELTKANYDNDSQGLSEIKVTYKITVTNASQTEGTATVITDYYDKCYSNPTAYVGNDKGEKIADIIKETKYDNYNNRYNKVEITLPENYLTQSESNYLYITFEMDVDKLITSFANKNELKYPTYNMAEITEYKTKSYVGTSESDKEYTRGLLDKDSAPGSVEREQVRTTETEGQNTVTTGGNPTTLQYYFEGKDLTKLKYEDDTYATPTLYFISNDSIEGRKITGTVFEDYTVIHEGEKRIKSGNGVQDSETGEPGIKGITVELIEKTNNLDEPFVTRYTTTTNEEGIYEFNNFLPGNYIIKYSYGDREDTFIVTNPNTKSYNGEDFQATNNTGKLGNSEDKNISKLNNTEYFWYAYNEEDKVSTATDNKERREDVSKNVTGFTDLEMQVLNNARDGQKDATVTGIEGDSNKEITITTDVIIEATKMCAYTPTFNMTVEKTEIDKNNKPNPKTAFSTYEVSNMNFGIAEVPVTTIDLQKTIKSFTIRDSADQNDIAKIYKDEDNYSVAIRPLEITADKKQRAINGLVNKLGIDATTAYNAVWSNGEDKNVIGIGDNFKKEQVEPLKNYLIENSINRGVIITHGWKVVGDIAAPAGATQIVAQIQDEKLQGAKLQITYEITASMYTERNFDSTGTTQASIKGVIDYIDNDLSYNEELGKNKEFWEVTSYAEALKTYGEAHYECTRDGKTVTVTPKGTLDPEGKRYTTIVKAKPGNPLLIEDVGTSAPVEITLEKTLSSLDSSIMDIITSNIDSYEYDNNIEITGLNYKNTEADGEKKRDRIRTPERYIILAGSQHDSFSAEKFSIIPPTGENRSMNYFILAVIALGVLAIGIGGIRKFVVKK